MDGGQGAAGGQGAVGEQGAAGEQGHCTFYLASLTATLLLLFRELAHVSVIYVAVTFVSFHPSSN